MLIGWPCFDCIFNIFPMTFHGTIPIVFTTEQPTRIVSQLTAVSSCSVRYNWLRVHVKPHCDLMIGISKIEAWYSGRSLSQLAMFTKGNLSSRRNVKVMESVPILSGIFTDSTPVIFTLINVIYYFYTALVLRATLLHSCECGHDSSVTCDRFYGNLICIEIITYIYIGDLYNLILKTICKV